MVSIKARRFILIDTENKLLQNAWSVSFFLLKGTNYIACEPKEVRRLGQLVFFTQAPPWYLRHWPGLHPAIYLLR